MIRPAIAVAAAVLSAFAAGTAVAQTSRCTAAKYRAASKKAASQVKCFARAVAKGTDVDDACLAKAEAPFAAAFASAELRGDCLTVGDDADVEEVVGSFVRSLSGHLQPPRCCAFADHTCGVAVAGDCVQAGGTPGAPLSVCEGATGTCTTATPAPGNCCERDTGCDAGPPLDQTFCDLLGGTFSAAGNCTRTGCVP